MNDIDALLAQIPIDDIAKQLGVSPDVAESAVKSALPALLGGMKDNVSDEEGAAALAKTLTKHAGKPSLKSVADVDTADGAKIVNHVLGSKTDKVVKEVADSNKSSSVTSDLIKQLLPILAPIVLSWLANKYLGGSSSSSNSSESKKDSGSGGDVGDLIGDVIGGVMGSGAGGDLGSILGGLLGGK